MRGFLLISVFVLSAASNLYGGETVKILRSTIDGSRMDLIVPPEEELGEGSMVVLFYRVDGKNDSPGKFIAGKVAPRSGEVTGIQGEQLDDGTIRMRVFLLLEKEDIELLFELDEKADRKVRVSPFGLLAINPEW